MENITETINIREKIIEELKNRGINPEYIEQSEISHIIGESSKKVEGLFEGLFEKEINYLVREINSKTNRKIEKSDKQDILNLLLSGKTPEEIHEMEQYRSYNINEINNIESRNRARILAIKLCSIREISNILGIQMQSVYASIRNFTYEGKSISEIRKEKEEEVERRLKSGETIEDITNDKELNVDISAVKRLDHKIKEEADKRSEKADKETQDKEKQILTLLLSGKTPEEVHEMEELKNIPISDIQKIKEKNIAKILAIQLIPIEQISEETGLKPVSIYSSLSRFKIDGKSIMEIRREKKAEIETRLQSGESVESLLEDKKLNICREAIEITVRRIKRKEQIEKRNSEQSKLPKETVSEIATLLIKGKTIEDIKKDPQFESISEKTLEEIKNANMAIILAMQLYSIDEISKQLNMKPSTIYARIGNCEIEGKKINELRKEKLALIRARLSAGENIDDIAQDPNLNVSKHIIERESEKLSRKKGQKKKIKSKQTREEESGENDNTKQKNIPDDEEKSKQGRRVISKEELEEIKQKEQEEAHKKLEIMRKKYKDKYAVKTNSSKAGEEKADITEKEIEEANKSILEMLEAINGYTGAKQNAREVIKTIRNKAKLVYEHNVGVDQAEQLVQIIDSPKIAQALKYCSQDTNISIKSIRKQAYRRLSQAIEDEMYESSDLSRLEELSKKLKMDMEKNDFHTAVVRSSLYRKIDRIKAEERVRALREDIPEPIVQIISDIAKGDLNIESATQIINDQAHKKVGGRKQTRFTLTEEQERKQLISQIKRALSEQVERFPIKDSKKAMELLQQLSGDNLTMRLNVVVQNQLNRKLFDEAEETCQQYLKECKDSNEDIAFIRGLRKKIRSARVGDLVYRAVNSNMSIEDEEKFWRVLQNGMQLGNLKMRGVSIGKTEDGIRTITLEDIWPENLKEMRK